MSLLVVGALHWDVVVDAPRLPRLDETLRGHAVDYRFGGKGGNQAVAAAKAGARVAYAGRVGRDAPGAAMREQLTVAGVDLSALQEGEGASGMRVAVTVPGGDYGAVIVSGENHALDLDALRIPEGCRIVLAQNEMADGVLPALSDRARAAGAEFWVNLAPSGPLERGLADVLIVNRVEAGDLLGGSVCDGAAAARQLADVYSGTDIVVTLGADGAAMRTRDGEAFWATAPRVDVVSTHGAGDAFVGTLAAARLDGAHWPDAIARAQNAAARLIAAER